MLNIQSSKTTKKFVGAFLPPRIHSYLTLYSLAKGTFKSKLIRTLLESWINKQKNKEPDAKLIQQVISRLNHQWMTSKVLNPSLAFYDFKAIIRQDLLDKGLLECDVEKILKGINEK